MSITREQWISRYAARIVQVTGMAQEHANDAAKAGADAHEDDKRDAGDAISWPGESLGLDLSPEDAADVEMSYWDDDGDG